VRCGWWGRLRDLQAREGPGEPISRRCGWRPSGTACHARQAPLASEKFSPACRLLFTTNRRSIRPRLGVVFRGKWLGTTRASSGNRRASGRLWRAISVDRVSHKNASAKQNQNRRDCFDHFHSPLVYYRECLIIGVCFTTASSARHNGFVDGRPVPSGSSVRMADVGSQPAKTIKLIFRFRCGPSRRLHK
jgi:hypothetical protein